MNVILSPLLIVIDMALELYMWALIVSAGMSWLVALNIINTHNRVVYMIGDFLYRITEPVLRPIRRVMPTMSGIDLSPMILILGIVFLRGVVGQLAARTLY